MRISLYVLQVTLLFFIADISFGQIIWRDGIQFAAPSFSLYTNATTSVGARTIASGVSVTISAGSGITFGGNWDMGPAPRGAYSTTNWTTSTTAYANDDYIQFTINVPPATKPVILNSFQFSAARNVGGPRDYSFRTGSGSDVWGNERGSGNNIPNSATSASLYVVGFSPAIVIARGTSRSFRLYLKGATSSSGFFYLHDFVFNGSISLPVDFGTVTAVQKKETLSVKWNTLKETNNAYFEVQVSKDGEVFKTIKTVASKNGNSGIGQDYDVNIIASDVTSLLGLPVILGLMWMNIKINRKNRMILFMAGFIMLVTNFMACSRQGNIIEPGNSEKTFIRIVQVDIDGTRSYSKTVQVVDVKR